MPRKEQKYHYIYKTINLVNGKYYIGMHSTNNLEDGYIGSGKRLWYSLKKYGRENFKCEILEFLPNRSSLKKKEKELVNENILKDNMCMNLKIGGEGGFTNEEHAYRFHAAGGMAVLKLMGEKHKLRMKTDLEYRKKITSKISAKNKGKKSWLGKKHKEESKLKIGLNNSIKQLGEKNSQFETCWITNGVDNKKIKKSEKLPQGWEFGRFIKSFKKDLTE
jgi:hypothetical protein